MNIILVALESELPNAKTIEDRVIFTGVGKVNAGYHATRAILEAHSEGFNPTIINYGTAGLVSKKDLVGSLAEVDVILQRDMNAEPQAPRGVTPFDTDDKTSGAIMMNTNTNITLGTGDSFVMEPDEWFAYSNIDLVDMEAYAIAKVCSKLGTPFKCYKWVSDFADENAMENWTTNVASGEEAFFAIL
jgi:adenosylhomocysteine nucleosidase